MVILDYENYYDANYTKLCFANWHGFRAVDFSHIILNSGHDLKERRALGSFLPEARVPSRVVKQGLTSQAY